MKVITLKTTFPKTQKLHFKQSIDKTHTTKNKLCKNGITLPISCQQIDFSIAYRNKQLLEKIIQYDKNSPDRMILDVRKGFIDNIATKISTVKNPLMIAVSGESASGKSTLFRTILEVAKENNIHLTSISTDNYFKDISKLIKEKGSLANLIQDGFELDNPNNFYLDELKTNLVDLKNQKNITGRKYLMNNTGISIPNAIEYKTNPVIIVEGTVTLLDEFKDLFDAKIYVDTSETLRKTRLLNRAKERCETPEEALLHWNYVKEAGKKYVQPTKKNCDLVITGGFSTEHIKNLVKSLCEIKEKTH